MSVSKELKKFWEFIWHGKSIYSYIAFFVFAIIVLNIVYPSALFITSNTIGVNDVVAVVSGSMVHDAMTSQTHYAYLEGMNFTRKEIDAFPYNNGLNPGDLLLVWKKKPEQIKLGDVIVFQKDNLLIIHRVISITKQEGKYYFTTKGDHNPGSLPSEVNITFDKIKGVAGNRVPFLGIPKMLLTNFVLAVKNVL